MKIPVDKYNWIDYFKFDNKASIYIIEKNSKGKLVKYQYDGVGCGQGKVKGFLDVYFHSDLKWFSSEHWYSMTVWGENYPKEIVQSTPETDAIMDKFSYEIKDNDEFDKMSNEINHEISKHGIPTKDILKCILDEIKERTGIEWELGCDTNSHTKQWWEANIPLKYNGK